MHDFRWHFQVAAIKPVFLIRVVRVYSTDTIVWKSCANVLADGD